MEAALMILSIVVVVLFVCVYFIAVKVDTLATGKQIIEVYDRLRKAHDRIAELKFDFQLEIEQDMLFNPERDMSDAYFVVKEIKRVEVKL